MYTPIFFKGKIIMKNILVIGANGAIGTAFIEQLRTVYPNALIHAYSRVNNAVNCDNVVYHQIDYNSESEIELVASTFDEIDLIIIATGMLHDNNTMPEKSLRELKIENLQKLFNVNTVIPALFLKHFAPKLNKTNKSVFAILSARVGSISDNRLGGWYSYRMSKSALNMLIKTTAIEIARSNKSAIIVGLHPGTVASQLSQPFQQHVPEGKLFTPEYSTERLIEVIQGLSCNNSGQIFAWDGQEIKP